MKMSPAGSALLLLAALAFPILAGGPAGAAEKAAGNVTALTGTATADRAPAEHQLAARDPVYLADTITTQAASRVDLRLGRDLNLQIGEKSVLALSDFSTEITLALELGAVFVDKDPGSASRPLVIDSRFGQVSVRGTRVFVGPSRDPFAVFVERGTVTVTGGGRTVTVTAGQGTSIMRPGGTPSAPAPWGQSRIDAALAQFRR